jgi:3-hydroxy-9,10-secoandrosta-1,3,5(10)-triene-9,17-dione monooxygenase reductase component
MGTVQRDDQFTDSGIAVPLHAVGRTSKGSTAGTAIQRRGLFSVDILGAHQSEICARFIGQTDRRFQDISFLYSPDRLPLLECAGATLCCRVATIHDAGDHNIILREVLSGEEAACSPLAFHKDSYGSFYPS